MASRKPAMRWIIAAVVLLFFIVLLVVLDRLLTLDTVSTWVLRVGLIVLGLAGAGTVLWYMRPMDDEPVDSGDDVMVAIGGASARLPRGNFLNRPMVLVLGPEGSAKTSLVARSGGNPELLSGASPTAATEATVPTKTVNVWAMQQAIVTEIGGPLLSDVSRWAKVMRALRAPRVAAALGKGNAAPRSAVVCVPSDLFYSGGSGQQLEALGGVLRQRLAEASRELGLALPVYVVFTRMDKLPHFEPWVGVFTKDELRAPLGATMPFDLASNAGNYAERLSARLGVAFRQIVDVVGSRRVDTLRRENVQDRRYGAYELPRELQKLLPSITAFLVEICRPTQLGSSPQLRGFYFVGARPVITNDVEKAPVQQAASAPLPRANATGIFRDSELRAAAASVNAAPVSRRIPEWVFLDRLLRDVVLADNGAASVARGGVKVQTARRVMLGVATAASLLLLTAVTVSWLQNRAMTERVESAARAVASLPVIQATPGTITFPSVQALRSLEALRAQLDTIREYVTAGAPWSMRLGLWRGPALFDAARPVWYEGFRAQLFGIGWTTLVDSLKALPDVPGAGNDYGKSYNWLKAYLITTSESARSTKDFLSPVLLETTARGQTLETEVNALAAKQFDFYSSELPTYNPWPKNPDLTMRQHTRDFLDRFTGGEQIYRNMLAKADKEVPPLKLKQTPGIFTVMPQVPGSFTSKGATAMAAKFSSDSSDVGEVWVVGETTKARAVDKAQLRARYATDYANIWRQVVASAIVVRPTSVKDAATKLDTIANNTSPLLGLLQVVAVNTNSDSAMRVAFQPVQAVTPPDVVGKVISEKNQPYVDGLTGLQGALVQVANLPFNGDSASTAEIVKAAQAAGGDVTKARAATKKVAQAFVLTTVPSMAGPVERLLMAPIDGAEAALRTAATLKPKPKPVAPPPVVAAAPAAPAAAAVNTVPTTLNEHGARLCREMTPLLAKFPFTSDATSEATIADVTNMFAPGTGKLWAFEQDDLAPYLEKTGGKWVAKPSKVATLSPIFVEFFNRAAQISMALFSEANTTPKLQWKAAAEVSAATPLITFKHGVNESHFDLKTPKNIVDWPQPAGSSAALEATFGKEKPAAVTSAPGEWALFRMVAKGTSDIVGREVVVTWAPPATVKNATPVVMRFELIDPPGVPVLKRGWMGGMTCAAQVAQ